MTMFTRNDKAPESSVRPAASQPEKIDASAPPPVEVKRPPSQHQPQTSVTGSAPSVVPGVSIISRALKITGQLESTENIQIEGEIEGDVRGVSVKVGSNAKVKGSVYGEEVELSGTVEGKIEAKKVVLTSSAHMAGDVIHQDITIHSGAYIAGHCRPEFGKSESRASAKPEPTRA